MASTDTVEVLVMAALSGSLIPGVAALIGAINSRRIGIRSDERETRSDVVSEYRSMNDVLHRENADLRTQNDALETRHRRAMSYVAQLRAAIETKKPPPPPDYPSDL